MKVATERTGNKFTHTYREAVSAGTRFLQALRSAVLFQIKTELALAAVFSCARLTLSTSDPAPAWSITNLYLNLARLRRSTSSWCFWLSSLRHLQVNYYQSIISLFIYIHIFTSFMHMHSHIIIIIIIVSLAPLQCIAPFAANNFQSGLSSASSMASSILRLWYDRSFFIVASQEVWGCSTDLFQSLWGTAVRILLASADSSILGWTVRLVEAWVGLSSCRLYGSKLVHLGNGLPLIVLCHLVSLPVSMPLRSVNHSLVGYPCKWQYINVETFNLFLTQGRHSEIIYD